jgi:glycosyltransferase involved in cell wall biosynthesis
MSQPLISVCLPTFNGAKFVAASIESVLSQSHENFELIIVDDGSSDASVEIAKQYSAKSERIKFYSNSTRLGPIANYNKAVALSSGEFVKLFAQDDLLMPTNLERSLEALVKENNLSFVTTAKSWIDETGAPLAMPPSHEKCLSQYFDCDTRFSYCETLKSSILSLVNWIGSPTTTMLRRERFGSGFNTNYAQLMDLEFFLRLLQEDDAIYLSEQLCQFRFHPECQSYSNQHNPAASLEWVRLAAKHARGLLEVDYPFHKFCQSFLETYACWANDAPEIAARFEEFNGSLGSSISDLQLATLFFSIGTLQSAKMRRSLGDQDEIRNWGQRHKDQSKALQAEMSKMFSADVVEHLENQNATLRRKLDTKSKSFEKLEHDVLALRAKIEALELESRAQSQIHEAYVRQLNNIGNSTSWKITAPLRFMNKRFISQVKTSTEIDGVRHSLESQNG